MFNAQTYHAPWGKSLRWASALTVGICIFVPVMILNSVPKNSAARWTGFLVASILVGAALFTVRRYTIEPRFLAIQRLLWTTRLPLAGLQSATVMPKAMSRSIRLCGNGGAFSFTGWFRNRDLGVYRAFVTDLNRTVVLKFAKRTVVISPDRPEEFVAEIMTTANI